MARLPTSQNMRSSTQILALRLQFRDGDFRSWDPLPICHKTVLFQENRKMNESSLAIPIVPQGVVSWTERTLRFFALLIFPTAYLAGQKLFELILRTW